jgi:hypothetical protein
VARQVLLANKSANNFCILYYTKLIEVKRVTFVVLRKLLEVK